MAEQTQFEDMITEGYTPMHGGVHLGNAVYYKAQKDTLTHARIYLPFATLNRHMLVTGATGTGKTKTVQRIIEECSRAGIPSLFMDMKGDVSGIGFISDSPSWAVEKAEALGVAYTPTAFPVEYLSFSPEDGVPLRLSLSDVGASVVSKILDLTDAQGSTLTMLFAFAKDEGAPLATLSDLKDLIMYASADGREHLEQAYGSVSKESLSIVRRKLLEIESSESGSFFGAPSFDVSDLIKERDGKGMVNVLRMSKLLSNPFMLGASMLALLSELYESMPELGDVKKPALVVVIDEAHLLFNDTSKALLQKIEMMIKLIRSKGVAIIFCTQSPGDIPGSVLGQLGCKVSHALRAFTAKDRKDIDSMSMNYPNSEWYDVRSLMTELPIGTALVTALSEKGAPTELAVCAVVPPMSRMDTITHDELMQCMKDGDLYDTYFREEESDTASYYSKRAKSSDREMEEGESRAPTQASRGKGTREESVVGTILKSKAAQQVGRTVVREVVKGVLGALFKRR